MKDQLNHRPRRQKPARWRKAAVRVWDRVCPSDQVWLAVLVSSLTAHALFVVALQWVEPAPRLVYAEHIQRVARPPPVLLPPSGEPRRPIVWAHELRLSAKVRVRSLEPVSDSDAVRLRQTYERAAQLYPFYAGRGRRPAESFELRLVPFELLNDRSYFAVNDHHRVLGLYYPAANLCYLTPLALLHTSHLTHELAHHFADTYELGYGDDYEEAHARRFEHYLARYERLLATPHVHQRRAPVLPIWEAEAQRQIVDELLVVRSRNLLHPATKRWLAEKTRLAVTLFGASTGVPEPTRRALELRIVDEDELRDRAHFAGRSRHNFAHYYPRQGVLYATARLWRDTEAFAHYFAHHLLASSSVELDAESMERLACGFAWDMDRHLQHEVGALSDNPLATTGRSDDPARVRTLAVSILRRLGRQSRDDTPGSDPIPR